MRVTSGRISSLAAVAFVLVAIAAQMASLRHAGLGMATMARAVLEKGTSERAHQVARWHAERSGFWGGFGFGSAMVAVMAWLVARKAGEAPPRLLVTVLLMMYTLLSMVIV